MVTRSRSKHLTNEELEAGLDEIRRAPASAGIVQLIVRRPAESEREVLEVGELDLAEGLVGDTWLLRGSKRTPDGSPHPDMQLNVMSARASTSSRPVTGSAGRSPATSSTSISTSPRRTAARHAARARLGRDRGDRGAAHRLRQVPRPLRRRRARFVNTKQHRHLRLRGLNAKVVEPGTVRAATRSASSRRPSRAVAGAPPAPRRPLSAQKTGTVVSENAACSGTSKRATPAASDLTVPAERALAVAGRVPERQVERGRSRGRPPMLYCRRLGGDRVQVARVRVEAHQRQLPGVLAYAASSFSGWSGTPTASRPPPRAPPAATCQPLLGRLQEQSRSAW